MSWRDRLEKLDAGEDGALRSAAIYDAAKWPTCAIGENRNALRGAGHEFDPGTKAPYSAQLHRLGTTFDVAVRMQDWPVVLDLLGRIEEMAA